MGPNPVAVSAAATSTPAPATTTTVKPPNVPVVTSVKALRPDESLLINQRLTSPNGKHWLAIVDDGKPKLQLWNSDAVVFETEEQEKQAAGGDDGEDPLVDGKLRGKTGASTLTLRPNGALVLSLGKTAIWTSDLSGLLPAVPAKGAVLTVQDDGHAAVVANGERLWYSYSQKDGGSDRSRLVAGEWLATGQLLISPSGKLSLSLQPDGDFVLSKLKQTVGAKLPNGDLPVLQSWVRLWSVKAVIYGAAGRARVTLRDDDNLWIGSESAPEWTSKTRRRRGGGTAVLRFAEADEAAVLDSDGVVLWSTKTTLVQAWEAQKPVAVPADAKTDRVLGGQYLPLQQSLYSANSKFRAFIQPDAIYVKPSNDDTVTLWVSKPIAKAAVSRLRLGLDGNLVLAGADSAVVWESKSTNWAGQSALVLLDNGNLVLTGTGGVYWSSVVGSVFPAGQLAVDRLFGGQSLLLDQVLTSVNGSWVLRFTPEAQLIVKKNNIEWQSLIYTIPSQQNARLLTLSTSGRLEIREGPDRQLKWSVDGQKSAAWVTTPGVVEQRIFQFVLQEDGNAVLSARSPKSEGPWITLWETKSWPRGVPPAQVSDRLVSNATNSKAALTLGQGIVSPNGEFSFWLKLDGELELVSRSGRRLWKAGSAGKAEINSVILDGTGTLIVTAPTEKQAAWTSREAFTYAKVSNAELVINDSGSVVIASSGKNVWQINAS